MAITKVTTDRPDCRGSGILWRMASRRIPELLPAVLKQGGWSTTHEVAAALKVSESTARKHLIDLVIQGRAERTEDAWGKPGYTWRLLDEPIGMAAPTDRLLCPACVAAAYRDIVRYRGGLTPDALDRWIEAGDLIDEDPALMPACSNCGQPVF